PGAALVGLGLLRSGAGPGERASVACAVPGGQGGGWCVILYTPLSCSRRAEAHMKTPSRATRRTELQLTSPSAHWSPESSASMETKPRARTGEGLVRCGLLGGAGSAAMVAVRLEAMR